MVRITYRAQQDAQGRETRYAEQQEPGVTYRALTAETPKPPATPSKDARDA